MCLLLFISNILLLFCFAKLCTALTIESQISGGKRVYLIEGNIYIYICVYIYEENYSLSGDEKLIPNLISEFVPGYTKSYIAVLYNLDTKIREFCGSLREIKTLMP